MNFLKKNLFTVCGLVLLVTMGLCSEAWADGASLMTTAQTKTRNVFDNVKTITFIIGGLALGLAILAAAGSIVEYATGSTDAGLATTFGNI